MIESFIIYPSTAVGSTTLTWYVDARPSVYWPYNRNMDTIEAAYRYAKSHNAKVYLSAEKRWIPIDSEDELVIARLTYCV